MKAGGLKILRHMKETSEKGSSVRVTNDFFDGVGVGKQVCHRSELWADQVGGETFGARSINQTVYISSHVLKSR